VLRDVITTLLHKLLALSKLFVASMLLLFKKNVLKPTSASKLAPRLTHTLGKYQPSKNLASVSDRVPFYFLSIIHEIFSS